LSALHPFDRGSAPSLAVELVPSRAFDKHDDEVQFYAFDMLVSDGDNLRMLPLSLRKTNLARILARRLDGIHVAPFEQGEIGPDLFAAVGRMGPEGLVSKHRDSTYRCGRFDRWVEVKNRQHPAFRRVMEAFGET
jgi:bifunctional non-homologous end joining protein LigD